MTHFSTLRTKMTDPEVLVTTLRDLGITVKKKADVRGDNGQRVRADIVAILEGEYDIGWSVNSDGSYDMIADLSGVAKKHNHTELINAIQQKYAVNKTLAEQKRSQLGKYLKNYITQQAVTVGRQVQDNLSIEVSSFPSYLHLLPSALAQMHRLGIYPPLSLIQDLLNLTGGQPVNNSLAQLTQDTGIAELIALRWSTPARIGLVALLLHKIPFPEWEPRSDISPREISNALQAGLKGEPMEPQAPPPPISPLQEAAKLIDEQLLSLLTILGEQAVAAEPALPLRLLSRIPNLPALSSLQRQLLGVRVCFGDHRGRSIGNAPGAERGQVSGVETSSRTDWSSLLPSQLALPKSVLNYRYQRGELLFRTRELAEPPRLRPTVLLLDVTPPAFGPIEAITRISAFAVANFLRQADISVVLITNGEEQEQILQLDNPEDLVEIWTHRTISPANEVRSLKLANAIRTNLRDESGLEPIILLLTHPWFGAEVKLSRIPGLRGLFVQYPSMQIQPAIANLCDRYSSIDVEQTAELGEILGYLMG